MRHLIGMAAVAAAVSFERPAEAFVIAERGKPADCSVDVRHPGSCTAVAVKDLVDYTEKLTGVRLAQGAAAKRRIVLREAPKELGEDGFEISADGDELVIAGGRRGILYGVYDLLERFGDVAWLSSWCEDVPKIEKFIVPDGFRFRDRPRMAIRNFYWSDPAKPSFCARLRLNTSSGGPARPHLGQDALVYTMPLNTMHSFGRMLPPEKYFDAHPDWFSEVAGKRLKEKTQICLTNPGALAQCITNVLESIRKTPGANVVAIMPNDYHNFCACRNCKAVDDAEGSHAGSLMNFVNRIAEAVEREYPGMWINTSAYDYYRQPPKTIRLRDNVFVSFCAMELNWRDPPRPDAPWGTGENVRSLMNWNRICRHLGVWDYPVNCSFALAQQPNERMIQAWHRVFLDNGAYAIFSCGGGDHCDFNELKAYLSTKWLWNPDLPADPLIDRFFRGYYGAAAPLVRQFYDERCRLSVEKKQSMGVYESITSLKRVYSDDFYRRSKRLLVRAEALVKDDPVRAYNVRMTEMPIDYMLYRRLYRNIFFTKDDLALAKEGSEALANLMAAVREAETGKAVGHRVGLGMAVKRNKLDEDASGRSVRVGDGDRVVLEETALEKSGYGRSHVDVDDPKARDGKAMRFNYEPIFANPFTQLSLDRVQFKPGKKGRLTVRLRAEVPQPRGPVFCVTVYDGWNPLARKTFQPQEVTADYADYTIGEWTPAPGQVVVFSIAAYSKTNDLSVPTPAEATWIDSITLEQFD